MKNEIPSKIAQMLMACGCSRQDSCDVPKRILVDKIDIKALFQRTYELEKLLFDELGDNLVQVPEETQKQELPKEGFKIKTREGNTIFTFHGLHYITETGTPDSNNCRNCVFKNSHLCTEKMEIFGSCRENNWKCIHEYPNNK